MDRHDGPARTPRVKVLVVSRSPLGEERSDGIGNFIAAFVRCMPDDFEVEICGVPDDDSRRTGWQTTTFAGREIRYLPVRRVFTNSRRFPKVRAILGLLRVRRQVVTNGRVIQVHAPAIDLGLARHSSPLIRIVHPDLSRTRGAGNSLRWSVGRRLMDWLTFRRAAKTYFVNRATFETYAKREGRTRNGMALLPLFVDPSVFRPLSSAERRAARQALATELELQVDAPWIVFAGRLVERKKPMLALRAFEHAAAGSALDTAQLIFAGDGAQRAELERVAAELGISERVRFAGVMRQSRLATLMQAADAFLLTSAWEGGPTVVYEALAAGLPVVSTPVGDVSHLVTHASTGWVVESGADDSVARMLAAGLEWTLAQDRDAIAERCAVSMEPYHVRRVLTPFYEDHRVLAGLDRTLAAAPSGAPSNGTQN